MYKKNVLKLVLFVLFITSSIVKGETNTLNKEYRDDLYYIIINSEDLIDRLKEEAEDVFDELDIQNFHFNDSGYLPDAKSAVNFGLKIFIENYGISMVEYTPFYISFYKGAWLIISSYPEDYSIRKSKKKGEDSLVIIDAVIPAIILRQSDGKILFNEKIW